MGSWIRPTATSFAYQAGHTQLAAISAGQRLTRTHLRWGIVADTSIDVDYSSIYTNIITLGIVTTIGDGTETPPNARLASFDAAPPTQRWVYWETRGIRPTGLDASTGAVSWIDEGSSEPSDSKGQVLATGLGAGQTLNVWASWASPFAWDPTGQAMIWLGASLLVS